jgi:ElaB/YqjD/DUF883 family membrane-anchored ribosome-binding protein
MSNENTGADAKGKKGESSARHANGGHRTEWNEVARRATEMIRGFPASLDEHLKRNPYATLGIACAIGVGVGVLIGTRVLRTVVASAVSLAAVELGRAWVRQVMAPADGLKANGAS